MPDNSLDNEIDSQLQTHSAIDDEIDSQLKNTSTGSSNNNFFKSGLLSSLVSAPAEAALHVAKNLGIGALQGIQNVGEAAAKNPWLNQPGNPNSPGTQAANYISSINIPKDLNGGNYPIQQELRTAGTGIPAMLLNPEGRIADLAAQSAYGAAQDKSNPSAGALSGAAVGLIKPIASTVKSLSQGGINTLRDYLYPAQLEQQTTIKNSLLDQNNDQVASDAADKIATMKQSNADLYGRKYGVAQNAAQDNIPGTTPTSNPLADELESSFGKSPTTDYLRIDPELGNKYAEEMGFGLPKNDSVDNLIAPNFSTKLQNAFDIPTINFGTKENPIQPLVSYKTLSSSPTIGNALDTFRVFKTAAKSAPDKKTTQLLSGAADQIKDNMIIPGLSAHDELNGTNLAETYSSGDPLFQQGKQWESISPKFNGIASGNLTPDLRTAGYITPILKNAIAKDKVPMGSPIRDIYQDLVDKTNQNNQQKLINNNFLQTQKNIANNRSEAMKTIATGAQLPLMPLSWGASIAKGTSPLARMYIQALNSRNNQQQ